METEKIYSKLEEATYLFCAYPEETEPFNPETSMSVGSGVSINSKGYILTVAHVVTGRMPILSEDVIDTSIKYVVKTSKGFLIQY